MAQNGTNRHAVAGISSDACSPPISIGCCCSWRVQGFVFEGSFSLIPRSCRSCLSPHLQNLHRQIDDLDFFVVVDIALLIRLPQCLLTVCCGLWSGPLASDRTVSVPT